MPRKKSASRKKGRGPSSGSPGPVILADLYLKQRLSYEAIACRYGITDVTVMRWIRAAGIPPRSSKEATPNKRPGEGVIAQMYVAQKMSYTAIAEELGLSVRSVARYVKESGVTPRPRGEAITLANTGKPWSEKKRAAIMAARQDPEYRRKMSERFKGEKSHLWRGGKMDGETLRMQGYEWRQRRKECYERDGWICQDCGVHCTSKGKTKIQAHHILGRREGGGDDLGNLVTLCVTCHRTREHQ